MKKIILGIAVLMLMATSAFAKPVMDFSVLCAKGDTTYTSPIYRVGLATSNPDGFTLKTNAEFGKNKFGQDSRLYNLTLNYTVNNNRSGSKNAYFTFGAGAYKLDVVGDKTIDDDLKLGGFVALNLGITKDMWFEVKYTEIDKTSSYEGFQYGLNCRF